MPGWNKGQSGNPGGRPMKDKAQLLVEVIAREHTEAAMETLIQIMQDTEAKDTARVAAANAILDRGWGKPRQDVNLSGTVDLSTPADAEFDQAFRSELADLIIGRGKGSGEATH